jgi:hypothetical protein
MRRLAAAVLGFALVATVAPTVAAAEDVRESNRAFILENSEVFRPDATVEVHQGDSVEEMTAREALDLVLDRAGDRDLARLATSATHGSTDVAGDVWILGLGNVDCGTTTTYAPQPVFGMPVQEQFYVYDGFVGYNVGSSAEDWWADAWTLKETVQGSGTVNYGGLSNFFCVEDTVEPIGWDGALFPFIDGYATEEPVPPQAS